MSKEIIKPLDLGIEIRSADLKSVIIDDLEGTRIIFSITLPKVMKAKITFTYSVSLRRVWSDIAYIEYSENNAQDESNRAPFTIIEDSNYLNKLITNKDLGLKENNLKHYRLWFRDDFIEIIGPEPTFEIIRDWPIANK